jgi:hypothetical protein
MKRNQMIYRKQTNSEGRTKSEDRGSWILDFAFAAESLREGIRKETTTKRPYVEE